MEKICMIISNFQEIVEGNFLILKTNNNNYF